MTDAPELILRRTLASMLDAADLAVYQPTGTIPERGIRLDGVFPTSTSEFTVLTSLPTVRDGRADALYRVQVYTRRTGSPNVTEKWAVDLAALLDHKEYTPQVLGISWAEETSRLPFDPDAQGRPAVACTYQFRGRA
ncbi:hypothetical protein [Microbacterium sp. BR1]|uniref:hypothetical protein n=1 Tax=Microbacterium sp. BR1 TaxID=1070896 RepID=UPI000C2CD66A|nr:hypothetical protein [Microbacterium sp. BR1]